MRMFSAFAVLALACAVLLLAAAGGASAQQSIITRQMFESMLSHRGDSGCEGAFYTYDAFVQAAKAFPALGTTGNDETRRRELAAFFGQTSHETTGGWATAPGGQFAWGYCRVKEQNPTDPPYYGRGPIQLTHKYNYEQAGEGLGMGMKLVNDPDLVSRDPVVAFKTALWFWMTPQSDKPSCHAVMTNNWTPSGNDRSLGRLPGYGMTSNIINGGQECGKGQSTEGAKDRVGFYKSYCDMLGVGYGDNVPCRNMKPYGG